MTITRLWQSGFELGNAAMELTNVGAGVSSSTLQKKTGSYALSVGSNIAGTYKSHDSNLTKSKVGFHVRHTGTATATPADLIAFRAGATDVLRVTWDQSNGRWIPKFGATSLTAINDAAFQVMSTWFHISIEFYCHASLGYLKLWRDGNLVIDTALQQTTQGASAYAQLHIGTVTTASGWNLNYYDDMYWDNMDGETLSPIPPDIRLPLITPNGNGNYSQMLGSDGNSTDNYLLVDEIPHDTDTTYVIGDLTTEKDSYAMTTTTIEPDWTLAAVIPIAVARKVDAGGLLGLQLGTRYGGTDQLSAVIPLGTSYAGFWTRQVLAPDASAWDQTELDGVEIIAGALTA